MFETIFIIIVLLAVIIEAYHDHYVTKKVYGISGKYNNNKDRVSKRFKFLLLAIVWTIGIYFDQTRKIALYHLIGRIIFFDYLYEVFRYWHIRGWKTLYKAVGIALRNNEILAQLGLRPKR